MLQKYQASYKRGGGLVVCVLAVGWVLLAAMIAMAQSGVIVDAEYTVTAGSTAQIPAGNYAVLVERFTMGDGSRIEISDDTPLFVIRAKEVVIGNNTMIFGRGRDGENGEAGEDGTRGGNGPTIVLLAEKQNIQGLSIIANGGKGGSGGSGHRGSGGREASCSGSGAGNGGPGGRGGNAGDGGNGGDIFVILPRDTSGYGISLNVSGGESGEAGRGGPGGAGGRGRRRCGPWPYWSRGEGSPGPTGPAGAPGVGGEQGVFRTYHLEDFEPATIADQLEDIISLLHAGGYAGDAAALQAVLDAGVLIGGPSIR